MKPKGAQLAAARGDFIARAIRLSKDYGTGRSAQRCMEDLVRDANAYQAILLKAKAKTEVTK